MKRDRLEYHDRDGRGLVAVPYFEFLAELVAEPPVDLIANGQSESV
jgi:hypothetical protein